MLCTRKMFTVKIIYAHLCAAVKSNQVLCETSSISLCVHQFQKLCMFIKHRYAWMTILGQSRKVALFQFGIDIFPDAKLR